MEDNKQYYENLIIKGQAIAKGANIGWKKFMDISSALNATLLEKQQEASGGLVSDEMIKKANEESEIKKQQVIEAIEERDSWYAQNEDEIGFADKFISGAVESLSNPLEVGSQIALGIATGGLSIPAQLGVQVGFDVAQANIESKRYEDRYLTIGENIGTAASSIAPDLLFMGVGAIMRKTKGDMLKGRNILGDATENPRQKINDFDNLGRDSMSKPQQIQTDYPNTFKEDMYNVKSDRYVDPMKEFINDVRASLETPEMRNFNALNKETRDAIIEAGGSDPYNLSSLHIFDSKVSAINNPMLRIVDKEVKGKTYLQRKVSRELETGKILSYIKDSTLLEGLDIKTNIEDTLGKGFLNKTDIQKNIIINNKYNNIVDNFAKDIKPSMDDYVSRWGVQKTKYDLKGIDKPVKLSFNTEQLDVALNAINTKLETQKLYIQNEYINILNSNKSKSPVHIEDYIKEVGYDKYDMATAWVKGESDIKAFDSKIGRGGFLENAFNDSVIIDELGMKVSLYDVSSYESFSKKFASSFDLEGDIKFDGNIFENLAKANADEKDILIRAMKDNPSEYVELIYNAKDVLGNIGNKRYPNISDDVKVKISNIFGTDSETAIKHIKKNKEFINTEYDKLIKEIPIETFKEPKIWKREVVETMAKNRKKNALESIKINETINKQNMLGYFDRFFTEGIDANNFSSVELKGDMKQLFDKSIMPFYYDGILKTPKDGNYVNHFAEFVSELKKTRKSAKVTGEYKTIGELRDFFEPNQMSTFFTQITDTNGKSFLKTNAQMVRDIIDIQANDIALYSEYGSVSPYVLKNKIQYGLNNSFSKLYGKELNDAQKKVVGTAQKRAITMLENTQLGFTKELPTQFELNSSRARSILRRGSLGLTGLPELIQNPFIASARAQKYGGLGNHVNTPMFQFKKLLKTQKGDLPNNKYIISQMSKDLDMSKYANKSSWDKIDDFAFWFQELSAKQAYKLGEAHTTSILHNLPKDYDLLENEMKDLLRMNGINKNNFDAFSSFTKKHIGDNNLIVNINELSKNVEFGFSPELSNSLRNVYYQIADYIGDPMYKSKMNNRVQDEIQQWFNMFRAFSRAMNGDTLSRLSNYVDANGVAKNRFGKTIINPQYIKDLGLSNVFSANDWNKFSKNVSKELGLLTAGGSLLLLGGYGYTQLKELIQSDRTLNQKLSVVATNTDKFLDAMLFMFNDKSSMDFIKQYVETTGLNPLDSMEATNLPTSIYNRLKKIYNTFNDEDKKTLGTNAEEGIQATIDAFFSIVVSRVATNWAKAMYKETQGDIETLPEHIFGMSSEDMEAFRADLRNRVENGSIGKSMNNYIGTIQKRTQAEIDYMENNTNSYDKLKPEVKQIAEVVIETNPHIDPIELRTSFPIIWSDSNNIPQVIQTIGNTQNINVKETLDAISNTPKPEPTHEFDKLSDKKQNYFYMIMKYKGIENITEKDYDLFVKHFKDIKTLNIGNVLKDVYGIDRNKFNEVFKDSEERTRAIRYYK